MSVSGGAADCVASDRGDVAVGTGAFKTLRGFLLGGMITALSIVGYELVQMESHQLGEEQSYGPLIWTAYQLDRDSLRIREALQQAVGTSETSSAPIDEAALRALRAAAFALQERLVLLQGHLTAAEIDIPETTRAQMNEAELYTHFIQRVLVSEPLTASQLVPLLAAFPDLVSVADALAAEFLRTARQTHEIYEMQGHERDIALIAAVLALLFGLAILAVTRANQRSSQQSRQELALLRSVFQSSPTAFAYYDADDRLQILNKAYAATFDGMTEPPRKGETYESIIRRLVGAEFCAEAEGREEEWVRARLAMRKRPASQTEQMRRDGRWIQVLDRHCPDGGLLSVIIDVTEAKKTGLREQALDRSRFVELRLGRFQTAAALEALEVTLSLLEQEREQKSSIVRSQSLLSTAQLACADLRQDLERQALLLEEEAEASWDLPQDAGSRSRQPLPLAQLLHNALSFLRDHADRHGIGAHFSIDQDFPESLQGDGNGLRRLLLLLADRVIEHTPAGRLDVSLAAEERGGQLSVTLGFDWSGRQTTAQRVTLTTDLDAVALLAGSLGGYVRRLEPSPVAPRLRVRLQLPLTREQSGDRADQSNEVAARLPSGKANGRLLVVHSVRESLALLKAYLTAMGLEFDAVAGGSPAVAPALNQNYDMILVAVTLPVAEELRRLCRHAKELDLERATPVIALLDNPRPEDLRLCRELGATGTLSYPVDPARLRQVLLQWLPSALGTPVEPDPAAPTGDTAVLIREALNSIVATAGGAVACELVSDFLSDLDRQLAVLAEATEALDRQAMQDQAKTITKAAQHFGATAVSGLAQQMAADSKDLPPGEAFRLLSEIEAAAKAVRPAYVTWQAGLRTELGQLDQRPVAASSQLSLDKPGSGKSLSACDPDAED
ncbi:MAG: PAS-domain containing protein [Pseudomonadota bacterium]